MPEPRRPVSPIVITEMFNSDDERFLATLRGVWRGDGWPAHATDIVALIIVMVVGVAISAKWFRWE